MATYTATYYDAVTKKNVTVSGPSQAVADAEAKALGAAKAKQVGGTTPTTTIPGTSLTKQYTGLVNSMGYTLPNGTPHRWNILW